MKFYIQITEEHPNENGEYAPIREGILKLFLDADTKILFTSKPLNNIDRNTPIEFEVDDKLYITNFIARLENSDNYGREPVLDKNLRTQPELYKNPNKPQRLRFRKLNQASANIGIIKAYKKDRQTNNFINDISGISNPKNEIYTIDLNQEINLKAFVYERQRVYVAPEEVTNTNTQIAYNNSLQQGNITKNIISTQEHFNNIAEENIKWAFKIVDESYHGRRATTGRLKQGTTNEGEAFVALGEKKPLNIRNKDNKSNHPTNTTKDNINKLDSITDTKSYVVLEHLQGDSITIKLSDIFTSTALESLIDKNIIFFAYNNSPTYCLYTDNELKGNKKIVSQDKITSIELKIVATRFRLEFDGEYLFFYENEREIAKWLARSGIAIDNKANGNEIKPIDRASIPSTDTNKSFYYDSTEQSFLAESDEPYFVTIPPNSLIESLKAIKDKSINITDNANQTIANINDDSFKFAENHNENKNINLAGAFSAFIQTLIKHINVTESLMIPLKVKYQKRILIMIERFKQTTESTTARMNIYIDRKRVDSSSKIADNAEFNSIYDIATPYAFILERPSPDSIGGELKLRIPEGRYDVGEWYNENTALSFQRNTLNLASDFVNVYRRILIHDGHSPKNSDGCLLIKQKEVKDSNNNIVANIISKKSYKKIEFTNHIQNNFTKAILGRTTNNIDNFVKTFIEVRVKNGF